MMRFLKTLFTAVFLFLALTVYGVWAVVELLETDSGRQRLLSAIEQVSISPEGKIKIGSLNGSVFSLMEIADVQMWDRQGLWMQIDRIKFHWDPWAFLERKILIQELSFATVQVIRKPFLQEPAAGPGPAKDQEMQFPVLPVTVDINRLAAQKIQIHPAVLGEEILVSLESRMGYWGLSQGMALNLSLTRIDEVPGSVDFKATFIPPAQSLVVDLKAYEPPGGILVRALAIPELPEMSAAIHGDGTLEEWKGRFNLAAGDSLNIEGQAEIKTITEATYGLNLLMASNISSMVNPEFKHLLGDSQRLNARLVLSPTHHLKIEEAEVSIPAGHLSAQGEFRPQDGTVDVRYQLTAGDSAVFQSLVPAVGWKSIHVSGTAKGMTSHPDLEVHLEAKTLSSTGFSVAKTTADIRIEPDRPLDQAGLIIKFQGKGMVHEPEGQDSVIKKIGRDPLGWMAQGTLYSDTGRIDLDRFESSLGITKLRLNGRLDEWGQRTQMKGTAIVPDISRFSNIAGRDLAGEVNVDWQAEIKEHGALIDASFASDIRNLEAGIPELKIFAGEHLTLAGKVQRDRTGFIRVEGFTVKGAVLSAYANLNLHPDETVQADWSVDIPQLSRVSSVIGQELSGDLTIHGKTTGSMQSPSIKAKIESKTLNLKGVSIKQATVHVNLGNLQKAPSGNLDAIAVVNGYGASAYTGFVLQSNDLLLLEKTRMSTLGVQVQGNLKVGLQPVMASGRLNGRVVDFADINALLQQKLSGDVAFKIGLSEKNGQSADLAFMAVNPKMDGESPVSAETLELSVHAKQVLKNPVFDSRIKILQAKIPGMTVNQAILNAMGPVRSPDFDLMTEFAPDPATKGTLKASGKLNLGGSVQNLQLQTLSGAVKGIPFQMMEPASVTMSGSDIELNTLVLNIDKGRVAGDFKKNQNGILGKVSVDQLPLDLVNTFYPGLGIRGKLQGEAVLSALQARPSGTMKFSATEVTLEKAAEKALPLASADLKGDWNGKKVNVKFVMNQPSIGDFKFDGEVPLSMNQETAAFTIPQRAPLKGTAEGKVLLEILNDILLTGEDQVAGTVHLGVQVAGTAAEPKVTGKINLEGGLYENMKLGTSIDGIEMVVSLDHENLQLEKLYGRTPKKGTLSGKGDIKNYLKEHAVANLHLETKSAQLAAVDTVTAVVTSALDLVGPIEQPLLKGEIKIDRAEIFVPNNLPADIVVLEVEETQAREKEGKIKIESAGKKEPGFAMGLDLKIHAPGQVFVRGRGMDAELEGDLLVTGDTVKPAVDGSLKLRRGQLDLLGRKVKFKHGVVSFDEVPERDPQLDFKAEIPAKEITVLVAVLGAVSNPKFQLSSSPEKPQDEILARLLFDKSAGAMTPLEAVQLANSAAQLAGVGGEGPGLMDKVRNSLGLDTLKFSGGQGVSGPGVEVGRYVSEGVYVGVKQGLQDNSSSAVIEYEVTPNISLESDIGADAQSRLGIHMEWDY